MPTSEHDASKPAERAMRISESADFAKAISDSGLTIYDAIEIGDPKLWVPALAIESMLQQKLQGVSLAGLPLRTRSKVARQHVSKAMGYPVPDSFKETKPQFPGQRFDVYVQKSDNLQIWNEGISPSRRYVLIRVDDDSIITRIKVVNGSDLAKLDRTGTLTKKNQARLLIGDDECELISETDTKVLQPLTRDTVTFAGETSPVDPPAAGELLSVAAIYEKLKPLIGTQFQDAGVDQERNRGAAIHRRVCRRLGYRQYADDGRFPDVRHQLLEVKLQTATTIDLGMVSPASRDLLDLPKIGDMNVRHCDSRYAIFYAEIMDGVVTVMHFFLVSGQDFFERFPQCQGKVLNEKLQLRLPDDFFEG